MRYISRLLRDTTTTKRDRRARMIQAAERLFVLGMISASDPS